MMSMLASRKSDNSFSQFEIVWAKLWVSLLTQLLWQTHSTGLLILWQCLLAQGSLHTCHRGSNILLGGSRLWHWRGNNQVCHNQKWSIKSKWPRFNSIGSHQTKRGDNFSLQVGWKSSMPYLGRFLGAQLFGAISAQVHFSFLFKCGC